jgi:peptidoglycan hydrolase CwlO-like protein
METTIITFGLGVVLTLIVLAIVSLLKSNKKISELDSLVNYIENDLQQIIDGVERLVDESYHDLDRRLDSRVDRTISQFEKEIEEMDLRLDKIIDSFNLQKSLEKENIPN